MTEPSLNFLAVAVGWFAAAYFNYLFQRKLDSAKESRRVAAGKRIITADVRLISVALYPWFFSFMELRLGDLLRVYERLDNDLRDKEVVAALTSEQFETLLALADRFGRDIAMEQRFVREYNEQDEDDDNDTAFRNMSLANFAASLAPLLAVGGALSDDAIITKAKEMVAQVERMRALGTNEFLPPEGPS